MNSDEADYEVFHDRIFVFGMSACSLGCVTGGAWLVQVGMRCRQYINEKPRDDEEPLIDESDNRDEDQMLLEG